MQTNQDNCFFDVHCNAMLGSVWNCGFGLPGTFLPQNDMPHSV
mgnify:CR=1 FL=1